MRILVIGGTGAMGKPLVEYLSRNRENEIFVVSRHKHESPAENIFYIKGDIRKYNFFVRTVIEGYDVIVDFMVWTTSELKKRIEIIFNCCRQYITMSTSAVYAGSEGILTEDSPLLLDSYSEKERRQTFRYHIKKSVDDRIIMNSRYHHWTLARPGITFNQEKLPFLNYQKNLWLYRYLNDQTIIVPEDVLDRKTVITCGDDVALAIGRLVGNPQALGEVVHVMSDQTITWREQLELYQELLPQLCGKPLKIKYVPNASVMWRDIPEFFDAYARDRYFDRCFSTEKLTRICGKIPFGDAKEQLRDCMKRFLETPGYRTGRPQPDRAGMMDRLAKEHTPLRVFGSRRDKRKYIVFRSGILSWLFRVFRYIKNDKYHYLYQK